ncbi:MAG: CopD family protein, partial [Ilumatobacteraceae bacterium]
FFVWTGAWNQRVIQQAVAISIGTAFAAGLAQLLVVASDISGRAPWSSTGSLSAALETDAGIALLVRIVLLLVLAWVMFAPRRGLDDIRWNASGVLVLVLLGTWAYAGHSQSMRWSLIGMPLDIAHHAGAAAWIGGLAIVGLVATKTAGRDELVDVVQRFGKLAAISVGVIVGTGVIQAIRLVGSPTQLFAADHGIYLVAKLIFLGVMLKVADINRKRVGRRFQDTTTATSRVTGILRRAMGTELVVGLAVIGITAAMVVSPPAVAQQDGNVAAASSTLADAGAGTTTTPNSPIAPIDAATSTSSIAPIAVAAVECVIEPTPMAAGSSGQSVVCLQSALISQGVYSGALTGQFDQATDDAVRTLQQQRGLAVDGIVGRQTASALGIWPQT